MAKNKESKKIRLRPFTRRLNIARAKNRPLMEMRDRQRKRLNEMNRLEVFDEELIRKYLALINVEEFKMREK